MPCEVCGGSLEQGTNRCEYCGHVNSVAQSADSPGVQIGTTSSAVFCSHCGSNKVTLVSEHKAFDAKKAIIGGVLTGGVGLVAGFIGKKADFYLCNQCGYKWEVPTESITEKIKKIF